MCRLLSKQMDIRQLFRRWIWYRCNVVLQFRVWTKPNIDRRQPLAHGSAPHLHLSKFLIVLLRLDLRQLKMTRPPNIKFPNIYHGIMSNRKLVKNNLPRNWHGWPTTPPFTSVTCIKLESYTFAISGPPANFVPPIDASITWNKRHRS